MPDTKITALTAIGANPIIPSTFPIPMVDLTDTSMAASGTTKKVTVNQILGAGGTATLASATITGDLTVDTNTLKVNSSANRVGVVTTNLFKPLTVEAGSTAADTINQGLVINSSASFGVGVGASYSALVFSRNRSIDTASLEDVAQIFGGNSSETTSAGGVLGFSTKSSSNVLTERYRIDNAGIHTWSNVGGVAGTAMTLNATGLGVGMSPSASLSVLKSSATQATGLILRNANGTDGSSISLDFETSAGTSGSETSLAGRISGRRTGSGTTGALDFFVNNLGTLGSAKMTLDASGQLFVGTTAIGPWNTRLTLSTDSGTTKWSVGPWSSGGDTNFAVAATNSAGGVFLSGTAATSWTAISDERLKDIIEPITNAVTKIGSLRTVIGKFKNDENNTRKAFLIAQDVQAVLPEAVDASNPDRLGLAYTEVIPLLVAAIKELAARVKTLETR